MATILHRLETPATPYRPAAVWTLERRKADGTLDVLVEGCHRAVVVFGDEPRVYVYSHVSLDALEAIARLVREYAQSAAPAAARG